MAKDNLVPWVCLYDLRGLMIVRKLRLRIFFHKTKSFMFFGKQSLLIEINSCRKLIKPLRDLIMHFLYIKV